MSTERESLFSFAVMADVPEAALRHEYDELVSDGYSETWDEYLKEQERSFLDHASGWWTIGAIAWGVKRTKRRPKA